ncbi:transmembrane protease serine 9-like isoform X2 [Convolutriloba macropyga]
MCAGGEQYDSGLTTGQADKNMFPADACTGDSGGPLECFSQAGERYLCGIVSFGPGPPGCGTEPGSYTKVNHPANLAFISSIADLEPVVKTDWITDPQTFQFTGRNEKSSKVQLVSWSVHLQVELVVTMKILVS